MHRRIANLIYRDWITLSFILSGESSLHIKVIINILSDDAILRSVFWILSHSNPLLII